MLYLAIAQHRKQLTVNLRNEQGDVVLKRQVSTEWHRRPSRQKRDQCTNHTLLSVLA